MRTGAWAAHSTLLSAGFFPWSPGHPPNPGLKGGFFISSATWESHWTTRDVPYSVFIAMKFTSHKIDHLKGNNSAASSRVAQMVKRLPTRQETWVQSLGREDPLEKEMATHSSTLAWKIPWMEKPDMLQSMELQRVGHD